jgi:hypothetical protein
MQTEMNTEMRELTSAELDAVNGGVVLIGLVLGALWVMSKLEPKGPLNDPVTRVFGPVPK